MVTTLSPVSMASTSMGQSFARRSVAAGPDTRTTVLAWLRSVVLAPWARSASSTCSDSSRGPCSALSASHRPGPFHA